MIEPKRHTSGPYQGGPLDFVLTSKTPESVGYEWAARALARGLPILKQRPPRGVPLAVLGGGPSLNKYRDEIAQWQGERWAINGAMQWCQKQGIGALLFACDPDIGNLKGVTKAILAQTCPDEIFEAMKGRDVRLHMIGPNYHGTGPSTATATCKAALLDGYTRIFYYGCEGSFEEHSHAYANSEDQPWRLDVKCNGKVYRTEIEYLVQCEYLARLILRFPDIYHERSGGLLRAMIASRGDYDIEAVSPRVYAVLTGKEDFMSAMLRGYRRNEAGLIESRLFDRDNLLSDLHRFGWRDSPEKVEADEAARRAEEASQTYDPARPEDLVMTPDVAVVQARPSVPPPCPHCGREWRNWQGVAQHLQRCERRAAIEATP